MTGKVPFPGGTHRDKARRHCEDIPLNPRRFNLGVDRRLRRRHRGDDGEGSQAAAATAEEVVRRWPPGHASSAVRTGRSGRVGNAIAGQFALRPCLRIATRSPAGSTICEDGADESPSQISQRTDPVASAAQETVPDLQAHRAPCQSRAEAPWFLAACSCAAAARRRIAGDQHCAQGAALTWPATQLSRSSPGQTAPAGKSATRFRSRLVWP